jgi:hypothetical protein
MVLSILFLFLFLTPTLTLVHQVRFKLWVSDKSENVWSSQTDTLYVVHFGNQPYGLISIATSGSAYSTTFSQNSCTTLQNTFTTNVCVQCISCNAMQPNPNPTPSFTLTRPYFRYAWAGFIGFLHLVVSILFLLGTGYNFEDGGCAVVHLVFSGAAFIWAVYQKV